jgi:ribose-phosphate pyrophosphokinase
MGNDVKGKNVFIADDLISSGESMIDIAVELKKRKANKIICYATYGMFTNGLGVFNKMYEEGTISAVFGTNLTYRMPALLEREWFHEVDVSKYAAHFIAALNHDVSITTVINPHDKIQALLAKQRGTAQ